MLLKAEHNYKLKKNSSKIKIKTKLPCMWEIAKSMILPSIVLQLVFVFVLNTLYRFAYNFHITLIRFRFRLRQPFILFCENHFHDSRCSDFLSQLEMSTHALTIHLKWRPRKNKSTLSNLKLINSMERCNFTRCTFDLLTISMIEHKMLIADDQVNPNVCIFLQAKLNPCDSSFRATSNFHPKYRSNEHFFFALFRQMNEEIFNKEKKIVY